jgi:hypothetical protein
MSVYNQTVVHNTYSIQTKVFSILHIMKIY